MTQPDTTATVTVTSLEISDQADGSKFVERQSAIVG